jgi:hypothetical protein
MTGVTPDASAKKVEQVWEAPGKPIIVCGYMHERRTILDVHVLGELDTLVL